MNGRTEGVLLSPLGRGARVQLETRLYYFEPRRLPQVKSCADVDISIKQSICGAPFFTAAMSSVVCPQPPRAVRAV